MNCKNYFISMLLLIAGANELCAQGDLLITPRRVVFDGDKKIQQINLANIGKDTARYLLTTVEVRMKPDGSFEYITEPDPGQKFATPYLRFFPRNVVLGPNESQLLKVQLTKTSELEPGEYRSHVYFRAVNEEKPLGEIEAVVDSSSISVSLIPVFGITIPVIIRVGPEEVFTSLTDLKIQQRDTIPFVYMKIHRSGNMSVYGDIRAEYTGSDGKTIKAGIANGVAVYTPNANREFSLPLQLVPGMDLGKGKLTVKYLSKSDNNPVTMAEAELILSSPAQGQHSGNIEK